MRPASPLFVAALLVASAVACHDTPVDPLLRPARLTFASEVDPVFCLATTGVTQQSDGAVITVTGTSGSDAINCSGASLPVVINALDGNDWAVGSGFADNINGGDGCDRVAGGPGNDVVDAGPGNDTSIPFGGCFISGGGGSGLPDQAGGGIFGTGGDDLLLGGPGDDGFNGGDGFDTCVPGPGAFTANTCEVVQLEPVDNTPPVVTATLTSVRGDGAENENGGTRYRVTYSCTDETDPSPALTSAEINDVTVLDGQLVHLVKSNGKPMVKPARGPRPLMIMAAAFELTVTCQDDAGNVGTATVTVSPPGE